MRIVLAIALAAASSFGGEQVRPAAADLATRLIAEPDEAARQRMLDADGSRLTPDLRKALHDEGSRLASSRRLAEALVG